jgi:hypothetical protein
MVPEWAASLCACKRIKGRRKIKRAFDTINTTFILFISSIMDSREDAHKAMHLQGEKGITYLKERCKERIRQDMMETGL